LVITEPPFEVGANQVISMLVYVASMAVVGADMVSGTLVGVIATTGEKLP
jgi:hypothetical protein